MISSDSASSLEVDGFTKENHIRAKYLLNACHVPDSSQLFYRKYLIHLPTHFRRQILVILLFTHKKTEDWEVFRDFTVRRGQGSNKKPRSPAAEPV